MVKKAHKGFKKVRKPKAKKLKVAKTSGAGSTTIAEIGDLASKAWSGIQYIGKLINVEANYLNTDTTLANTDFIDAGIIQCYSLMATGDGIGARTGNSIRPLNFEYHGLITTAVGQPTTVRVIIFRQKQSDNAGTIPAVLDVLEQATIMARYNHENLDRYTILMDTTCCLHPNLATTSALKMIEYNKPMSGHITYDATSSSQSSSKSGHVYVLHISDRPTGATAPTSYARSKLVYSDN